MPGRGTPKRKASERAAEYIADYFQNENNLDYYDAHGPLQVSGEHSRQNCHQRQVASAYRGGRALKRAAAEKAMEIRESDDWAEGVAALKKNAAKAKAKAKSAGHSLAKDAESGAHWAGKRSKAGLHKAGKRLAESTASMYWDDESESERERERGRGLRWSLVL